MTTTLASARLTPGPCHGHHPFADAEGRTLGPMPLADGWSHQAGGRHVAGGSCGLDVIEEGLLIIWAPTVVGTSELAGQLWDARQDFASIGVSAVRSWAEGAR